ncbi:MAG: FtsX-like permease family protein, partial [Pseudolysinimonas sp.]
MAADADGNDITLVGVPVTGFIGIGPDGTTLPTDAAGGVEVLSPVLNVAIKKMGLLKTDGGPAMTWGSTGDPLTFWQDGYEIPSGQAEVLLTVTFAETLGDNVRKVISGATSRERRLATLRLAGATPGEVRRVGALEVGLPVTVGAMAGPIGYALLRVLFGGHQPTMYERRSIGGITGAEPFPVSLGSPLSSSPWALVPTSVTPQWWQIAAIVACVAGVGVLTGALASRHLIASPLGVSRRAPRPRPRPWGFLLIVVGAAPLAAAT